MVVRAHGDCLGVRHVDFVFLNLRSVRSFTRLPAVPAPFAKPLRASDSSEASSGAMVVEAEKQRVVELGSFSILNPKPPGGKAAVDGDFSVDSGNAATGAKLFKAKCASCHTIKEGGALCGPIGLEARWGEFGSGGARASGLVTRVRGLTTTAGVTVRRPEHARAKSARDHGATGWEGVRLASATHRSVCTQHRPRAIAAKRAEVHQGYEDERDHVGQRDHVQLANKSQVSD